MGSPARYRIPLSAPCLIGKEREYLSQALDQNQLTAGAFVERFEAAFAEYVGAKFAIATSSGTTALHLALLGTAWMTGDWSLADITCPTLTYIAAPNAIRYCDADPTFLDADPVTWQATASETDDGTPHLAVHLYGVAAPIPDDGRTVIEDCAEALGTRVGGQHVGTFGLAGAFSFYGNKVITTGEGGMVVTNDPEVAARVRLLRGQGMDPARRYYHPVVGFNYRMTNLQAAVGLGQLETIEEQFYRRVVLRERYHDQLHESFSWPTVPTDTIASPWLMAGTFETPQRRLEVEQALDRAGIESRPVFYPCHAQPPYEAGDAYAQFGGAWYLYNRGLCLPLHAGMTLEAVDEVCVVVREAVSR